MKIDPETKIHLYRQGLYQTWKIVLFVNWDTKLNSEENTVLFLCISWDY